MLVRDMIHSCSNKDVARASVACIGRRFAERVHRAAHAQRAPVGCFVADIVRNYASSADNEALAALQRNVAGSDQPILSALRHVVEQALQGGAPEEPQTYFPRDKIFSDRGRATFVRVFPRRSDIGRRTRRRELQADKLLGCNAFVARIAQTSATAFDRRSAW